MKYEHIPRPEIEHHYHIQELIEKQEIRTKDRNFYREQAKAKEERQELIADSADVDVKDFWCADCKRDFCALSHKEIEVDWSNTSQFVAFYRTKHTCGKWCIRYITDRNRDPYWFKSKKVAADRRDHHNDLLQPFETGYNMLYGK